MIGLSPSCSGNIVNQHPIFASPQYLDFQLKVVLSMERKKRMLKKVNIAHHFTMEQVARQRRR
jgi:hypothetical protein